MKVNTRLLIWNIIMLIIKNKEKKIIMNSTRNK